LISFHLEDLEEIIHIKPTKTRESAGISVCYMGLISNTEFYVIKLRGDCIRVILATIQSRTFCLLVCCLKTICKTIILPVVPYGRETWSVTLRE
jgi:hypothetical protein